MKYYQMTQCINHPNNKAEVYTGHVHKGQIIVDVGWCQLCANNGKHETFFISKYPKIRCEHDGQGCHGKWKTEYGIEEYIL